jgi:hypothetical protein
MAIPWVAVPEGSRVRVIQAPQFPQDPEVLGRAGTVVIASEYHTQSLGVVLDGEREPRYFAPRELETITEPALPPEREEAKTRRALP